MGIPVYVFRTATVIYKATLPEDMSLEEAKRRASKYGFKDMDLNLDWVQDGVIDLDDVESIALTDPSDGTHHCWDPDSGWPKGK